MGCLFWHVRQVTVGCVWQALTLIGLLEMFSASIYLANSRYNISLPHNRALRLNRRRYNVVKPWPCLTTTNHHWPQHKSYSKSRMHLMLPAKHKTGNFLTPYQRHRAQL